MSGFIKLNRSKETDELLQHPVEFWLLSLIASRARRNERCKTSNIQPGEALIGDISKFRISERVYRTAKKRLANWNFATFTSTNKGTIARIVDTSIYNINLFESDEQSDKQETSKRRARDEQETTNKNIKEEKKERNKEKDVCSEPEKEPAPEPESKNTFIELPLNDGKEYPITNDVVTDMVKLFPAVDVEQEFREMKAWLLANLQRRKTKSGIKRFYTTWLSKEQDRGGSPAREVKPEEQPKNEIGKKPDDNVSLPKKAIPESTLQADFRRRVIEPLKNEIHWQNHISKLEAVKYDERKKTLFVKHWNPDWARSHFGEAVEKKWGGKIHFINSEDDVVRVMALEIMGASPKTVQHVKGVQEPETFQETVQYVKAVQEPEPESIEDDPAADEMISKLPLLTDRFKSLKPDREDFLYTLLIEEGRIISDNGNLIVYHPKKCKIPSFSVERLAKTICKKVEVFDNPEEVIISGGGA